MNAKILTTDSAILDKKIFQINIEENKPINYSGLEEQIIKNHDPDYIQIIVSSENLPLIHYFEIQGFRFIELRIERKCKIQEVNSSSISAYPYSIEQILNAGDFNKILNIAEGAFFEDRFSVDYLFPKSLAKRRNIAFIEKSYRAKNEFLLKFFNRISGEIIGFQSGKIIDENRVCLFLNKINDPSPDPLCQEIFDRLVIEWLRSQGFKIAEAVSSAQNIDELNRSIKVMNFYIDSTWVLLRKIMHD